MTPRPAGGETSLDRLLAGLEPRLDPAAYRFVQSPELAGDLVPGDAVAAVREEEGWTLVRPAPGDPESGGSEGLLWARIALCVHSDLTAVGLLAVVTSRLAARRIPVNAMAGWYHDQLFVPWSRRAEALAELSALQAAAAAELSR